MKFFLRLLLVMVCLAEGARVGAQPNPAPQGNCLLVPLELADRAVRATLVVEAQVLDARSFWDAGHRRIYTAHRLRVFSSLKGTAPQQLTVLTEGGTVGPDRHELTNTLQLQPTEQGVLFLVPADLPGAAADGAWTVYGSAQGFIRYHLATATATEPFQEYGRIGPDFYRTVLAATGRGRRVVQPNPALEAALRELLPPVVARGQAPSITALSPTTVPAGAGEVLTLSGTGFGATRGSGYVEFRNADNGGSSFVQPQEDDYVSWSDTRIQVRVPSLGRPASPAGSGPVRVVTSDQQQTTSTAILTVPYALSNVLSAQTNEVVRPNPVSRNGRGGYTFRFEPGFAGNGAAVAAWQRALATWRCQTRMNWDADATPRTARGAADDGENSVGFDQGAELPAGILGRTTSYYRGCFRPDGRLAFSLHEIDMQFDDAATWQFGPAPALGAQLDFESVVVHELGHAQQLAHVILRGAVMHFAVDRAQTNRSISPQDVAGGRLVLRTRGFVPQGCGPAPMLPAPLTVLTATAAPGRVEVTWAVAAACFAESFQVQRSRDTTNWQTLATVATPGPYRYPDVQPLPGLAYYRLRLVLPDGSVTFTPPVLVAPADVAAGPNLFPNPVGTGPLQLHYPATTEGRISLQLYDAVGRLISSVFVDFQPGTNLLPVPAAGLSPGWYLLRYRDSQEQTGTLPFLKTAD